MTESYSLSHHRYRKAPSFTTVRAMQWEVWATPELEYRRRKSRSLAGRLDRGGRSPALPPGSSRTADELNPTGNCSLYRAALDRLGTLAWFMTTQTSHRLNRAEKSDSFCTKGTYFNSEMLPCTQWLKKNCLNRTAWILLVKKKKKTLRSSQWKRHRNQFCNYLSPTILLQIKAQRPKAFAVLISWLLEPLSIPSSDCEIHVIKFLDLI